MIKIGSRSFLVSLMFLCLTTVAYSQSIYNPGQHQTPSPKVPKFFVFAGDTVRFDRPDLYERMDRELIAFTYSQSISTLMLKRAPRYFAQIEPLLKLNGIPDDLKYLMVIESNLDPKAVSGAGAASLWQFMKAPAKEYGLVVDEEVDERYNIEKETNAACKYLKKAYAQFGNWITVAASYNGGMNGISKKLASQKRKSALDIWMVEETSRYMFRCMAAKMMFENPAAFGFEIAEEDKYPYYPPAQEVTVSGPIESLVDFAEQYGISYRQLKEANLWLRSDKLVNKAGHTYQIIIPSK